HRRGGPLLRARAGAGATVALPGALPEVRAVADRGRDGSQLAGSAGGRGRARRAARRRGRGPRGRGGDCRGGPARRHPRSAAGGRRRVAQVVAVLEAAPPRRRRLPPEPALRTPPRPERRSSGRALTFRPLARADLPRLQRWLNEPQVAEWWGVGSGP